MGLSREAHDRVSPVHWGEFWTVTALSVFFLALQLAVLPKDFVGPDTWKYLQIAQKQLDVSFWSDPSAFDYNYWPVAYPTFLSILFRMSLGDPRSLLVIQALMAVGLVLLTWLLAFRLGRKIRVVAAFAVALNPSVWSMARTGGYELLLSVGVGLVFLLLVGVPSRGGRTSGVLFLVGVLGGLVFGLTVLVQSKTVVLIIVVGWLAYKTGLRTLVAFAIGTSAILLPWALRNWIVLGSLTPFTKNGAINVWIGNNPDATTGGFMEPPPLPSPTTNYLQAAGDFVISQPEAAFSLLLRRLTRLLEPNYVYLEGVPIPGNIVLHFYSIFVSSVLAILLIAYFAGWVWRAPSLPAGVGYYALAVLIFFLVHLPFLAESRYLGPVIPLATIVSTTSVFALLRVHRPSARYLTV